MNSNKGYFDQPFVICLCVSTVLLFSFLFWGTLRAENASVIQVAETASRVDYVRQVATWRDFFVNNFLVSVITMTPFVGNFWGLFVQYNTGFTIGTLAKGLDMDVMLYLGGVMTNLVGVLEYQAYIYAYAESLYLIYNMTKSRFVFALKHHAWKTLWFVALCLFTASLIEIQAIRGM